MRKLLQCQKDDHALAETWLRSYWVYPEDTPSPRRRQRDGRAGGGRGGRGKAGKGSGVRDFLPSGFAICGSVVQSLQQGPGFVRRGLGI